MTTTPHDFDHVTLNIPGITLPSDPAEAERVLVAKVQAAQHSDGAAIPHATVMREMRARIEQAAQRGAAAPA